MGQLYVDSIIVGSGGAKEVRLLVDTGSTFTEEETKLMAKERVSLDFY